MRTDPSAAGAASTPITDTDRTDWSMLAVLVAVSTVGPLAMNIFMPSMPGLADYFNVPYGMIQLALTLYLFAMAISQLFLGPLSDRFGRRPVILGGLAVYILASFAAMAAFTIEWLILARIFQAAGSAAGMALARAMIRDRYSQDRAASLMGLVAMTFVVVPMIAPTIGGLLDDAFSWQASFLFCAVFGTLILVIALWKLPETRPESAEHTGFLSVFKDAGPLLTDRNFVLYTACLSFSSAMFFAFLGGAPFVVIELMGQTKSQYGFWFALGGAGYMFGNLATSIFSRRLGAERMVVIGVCMGLVGAGSILVHTLMDTLTPLSLFGSMTIVAFSNGLTMPNTMAKLVGLNARVAGSSAGISGFVQMTVGAAGAQIVGLTITTSALPMALVMFFSGCLSALAIAVVHRR